MKRCVIMLMTEHLLNADGSQLKASCPWVFGPIHPIHISALFIQLCPQTSLAGPLHHLYDLNGLLLTHVLDHYRL